MKKFIAIALVVVLLLALVFTLTACFESSSEEKLREDSVFVKVSSGILDDECTGGYRIYYTIYYHKDTKVMYVATYSSNGPASMTVMLNADGSVMKYKK